MDIPTPRKEEVKKMLVRRTHEHIIRLRCKILAHLHPEKFAKRALETYGFRTSKFLKNVECEVLKVFDEDLWDIVKTWNSDKYAANIKSSCVITRKKSEALRT